MTRTELTLQWRTLLFPELSLDDLYAILRLRQKVFVLEQHCVFLDLDNLDQQAIHILGTRGDSVVAYQRCIAPEPQDRASLLGRIVVSPVMRGRQLGAELVRRGIAHNLQRWPGHDIRISAQSRLQHFYTNLGFAAEGSEYLEDDIPHMQMCYSASLTAPRTPAGK